MSRYTPSGPPMTVADLAKERVTHVTVRCVCGRSLDAPIENLPTGLTMAGLARRFTCRACGAKAERVEPAWHRRSN